MTWRKDILHLLSSCKSSVWKCADNLLNVQHQRPDSCSWSVPPVQGHSLQQCSKKLYHQIIFSSFPGVWAIIWLAIRISGSIEYQELDVWVEYKMNMTRRHGISRNNKPVYFVNLLLPTKDTWIPSVSFPERKGQFSTCPALGVPLPKILLRWKSGTELTRVDPEGHFGQLLVLPHKYKPLWLMP